MIRSLPALALVLCSACSVLPESTPVDLYQLPAPDVTTTAAGPYLPSLRIDRPVTSDALNNSRLLIMTSENQFQALPDLRFAAPIPLLWRDWVLDAFWRDGRVGALSAASEGLQSQLELGGLLRAFQIENNSAGFAAVIRYDAILINTSDRRIIASQRFESRQPLESVAAADAVSALGQAANLLVSEMIDWAVARGQ